MIISYDEFIGAFLSKITEYELGTLGDDAREELVDGYMKRSLVAFAQVSDIDFLSNANDDTRVFDIEEITDAQLIEITDIVSDGMLIHWLKPYVFKQDLLENLINTRDFTSYSPAELLKRVGDAYKKAQKDYTKAIYDYSYNHGDLTKLHL